VLPAEVAERWLKKVRAAHLSRVRSDRDCGRVSLTPMGEQAPAGSAGKVTPLQKVKLVDSDTLNLSRLVNGRDIGFL